ncbi:MAG: FAD binding domain-containing protein [Kiritimatiellia bacterium]|jgi:CO/xanthine dehydrogenase FAD-binding subunit|nr:FAD binding domain-containing protein [Kiritimatiellia bacterium]MDP6631759.1 FAD binding domain-containing protein [Kiritimatiellia bacterium]MDP6810487.1 FAD binding domain-containing protein [Kiritimatiellia bacterium]MDP7024995.1 FAD binding domain-containing protein [Kiritimatiellia bacterium]
MKLCDFVIPADIDEARARLRELGDAAFPTAGGVSLHFLRFAEPKTAVDLTRLGLSGISRDNGRFTIGATTPVCDLQKHVAEGWVLDRVARRFVTQQIRNISTLGGNICRVFWWSDFPVALLALDASVAVRGESETVLSAEEFLARPLKLLKPGTLVVAIDIPAVESGAGFGYGKETRVGSSFSLATAAACVVVEGNRIKQARVAAGASLSMPQLLPAVGEKLAGETADREAIEKAVATGTEGLAWKGREGMSDPYAAELSRIIIADAITDAVAEART